MSGTSLNLDAEFDGLERLNRVLNGLQSSGARLELLEAVGAEVESQTHRRLRDEKESPDGEPWADWSENYAATRHGGHSLLMGEGSLDESIQFVASPDQVEVGTNLIYAAIQQFGGEEVGQPIPARPYLGLSDENREDLLDVLTDWAEQQIGGVR